MQGSVIPMPDTDPFHPLLSTNYHPHFTDGKPESPSATQLVSGIVTVVGWLVLCKADLYHP